MHTLILSSRTIFIFGLMLIGLAASTIRPTAQVAAAPAAPPTFTVNSFGDAVAAEPLDSGPCETATGNGICTLRAAIMKANHYANNWLSNGVTINLPAGTYVLTILPSGLDDELTGDLNLTKAMIINGVSAASTIIDANQIDRVISIVDPIGSSGTFTLSNVTLQNGFAAGKSGGGIYNEEDIVLNHIIISHNRAGTGGGGLYNIGYIFMINDSTISNNSASAASGIENHFVIKLINNSTISNNISDSNGGGIENVHGVITINNSTISNNSAKETGGGIANLFSNATLSAYYSTIVGNLADSDANTGYGGGIYNFGGTVNLKGTLLAQNYSATTPDDCYGTLSSQDYNMIHPTANCVVAGATAHNVSGAVNALIDSLKNNGGSTPTRALFVGSPAINAIPTAQCTDQLAAPLTQDQRGFPRPVNGACDIGAYEGSLPLPIYNRNLIRNGDAEDMAGSPTGSFVATPNWSRNYSGTLVPYGAPGGFPLATDPGPVDRGFGFFAGGVSAEATITQEINISSIAATIDAGKVHIALSGYFGGYATDDDYAGLVAQFLNVSHGLISQHATGYVHPAERGNQTGLLFDGTIGLVPAGTRFIVVYLIMYRNAGSYNDGYADNLSLVLWPMNVYLPLITR